MNHPRLFLTLLLIMVACKNTPSPARSAFSLVQGVEPGPGIQRVDIDNRMVGPQSLTFEVDCSAIRHSEGRQRDLCYFHGGWAVLRHERGILVACGCGEFGGFVLWYGEEGNLRQTVLRIAEPLTLICSGGAFLCVAGLSHGVSSSGSIHAFRLVDDWWEPVSSTTLAAEPERVGVDPDGSLVLKLKKEAGIFRYRAGTLEPIPTSYPQ